MGRSHQSSPPRGDDGRQEVVSAEAATQASEHAVTAARSARTAADAAEAMDVAFRSDLESARARTAQVVAAAAASVIEVANTASQEHVRDVAVTSARTESASHRVVSSTARVAELALDRLAQLRRAPLVQELHRAVAGDELVLHYQPMYALSTGAVVAVEALLRWQHPSRGLLPPAAFLDVAEGPHLVHVVGDWVIGSAVQQAAAWGSALDGRAPVVWANISCDQLGRGHLADVVERHLSESGLPPAKLGLELTERQLARRIDDVVRDLERLRELGVLLAVDDFGTGYASLDYLRRFAFDEIKIDRSFVSGLQDRTNTAVTASIAELGRRLELHVVAEGIETDVQRQRVTALGCDIGQGYHLHRPAPVATVTTLLGAATRGT